jgi:hypothetical protein
MGLRVTGLDCTDWTDLAWDRDWWGALVMYICVP